MPLLTPELKATIGRQLPPARAEVTRREICKYSVATGQRLQRFIEGDEAPPMFLFGLFMPILPRAQVGHDGLPPDSGLVPELPLKRVMAGGTRQTWFRGIYPGDVLVSRQTLVDLFEKEGAQGPLIFAVVENCVETEAGAPVMTERSTRIAR
ncbi:3-methylfumaryl-CoA hydratase [Marinobacter daqiaonensis]|uniref:3-methylfumaryl-CoA hydratase n=1 Tax=Marinobacter daqiaonensis TaxID=650891 RepID=A0A1I6IMZ5_9GAMM|nr:MaoC family dehydratase N-terminal domain-containing protein [Marinobacter daqiaonensis]SFR68103.1 3-methylfumaryl-CoA hydratase [Marinobacter daqiaonensis]